MIGSDGERVSAGLDDDDDNDTKNITKITEILKAFLQMNHVQVKTAIMMDL